MQRTKEKNSKKWEKQFYKELSDLENEEKRRIIKLQDKMNKKIKRTRVDKEIDKKMKLKQKSTDQNGGEKVEKFRETMKNSVLAIISNEKKPLEKAATEDEEVTKEEVQEGDEDTNPMMTISEFKEFREWEKNHKDGRGEWDQKKDLLSQLQDQRKTRLTNVQDYYNMFYDNEDAEMKEEPIRNHFEILAEGVPDPPKSRLLKKRSRKSN